MTGISRDAGVAVPSQPIEWPNRPPETPSTPEWEGSSGFWRDNMAPLIAGGVVTVGTGIMAGLYARDIATYGGGLARSGIAAAIAAPIAAGAAVALGWAGIRALAERNPDRPDAATVPMLPRPVEALGAPGVPSDGRLLGEAEGSYTELVAHTYTTTDGQGNTTTHTYYVPERRWFDWDIRARDQLGDLQGYSSEREAIEQTPDDHAALIVRDGERYLPYELPDTYRWGDLDDVEVHDPAVTALVSPGGRIWHRAYDSEFRDTRSEANRTDPIGDVDGSRVARYAVEHRLDPDVDVGLVVSGREGYARLEEALGQMVQRPGPHAVVHQAGRFHVARVNEPELDRRATLEGLLTEGKADRLAALEQHGQVYVPADGYWMTPRGAE